MSIGESRYAIVERVSNMDQFQTQKVLAYINDVLKSSEKKAAYQSFKERALSEINEALRQA